MKLGSISTKSLLVGTITGAAILLGSEAGAAETERVMHQNASNACQGALPAFAGTLRSRPLAVQNEGETTAFVTCSLPTEGAFGNINRLSVWFKNQNSGTRAVHCTGVFGAVRGPIADSVVKGVVVPGGGGMAGLTWRPEDTGGTLKGPANVSCALGPGVGVTDLFIYYDVEIGL